jgi:hypothetical protein
MREWLSNVCTYAEIGDECHDAMPFQQMHTRIIVASHSRANLIYSTAQPLSPSGTTNDHEIHRNSRFIASSAIPDT